MEVYSDANAYHKGQEPLARWLCERANTQENGIECPICGGQTKLSVANTGDKGIDDIHICEKCGAEVTAHWTASISNEEF